MNGFMLGGWLFLAVTVLWVGTPVNTNTTSLGTAVINYLVAHSK